MFRQEAPGQAVIPVKKYMSISEHKPRLRAAGDPREEGNLAHKCLQKAAEMARITDELRNRQAELD